MEDLRATVDLVKRLVPLPAANGVYLVGKGDIVTVCLIRVDAHNGTCSGISTDESP